MSFETDKVPYFLAGLGLGVIAAFLFTPESGKELRDDIGNATRRGIDSTAENVRALGTKAGGLFASGREKAADLIGAGKELLTDQRDRVAAALEAGKEAFQGR